MRLLYLLRKHAYLLVGDRIHQWRWRPPFTPQHVYREAVREAAGRGTEEQREEYAYASALLSQNEWDDWRRGLRGPGESDEFRALNARICAAQAALGILDR